MLSVIIPAYNEEANIKNAADTVSGVLEEAAILPYELIFVDDGSKDRTWESIEAAALENTSVRGIHFSRNFGKEAAIIAGLSAASGDCCVVIDCDLQHPPQTIPQMYALWQQGYEVIEGMKNSRGDEHTLHNWAAGRFYALISAATGFDMNNTSDFKLLDRKAVNVLVEMKERNAFFRALSSWIGFKSATVYFDVAERTAGESKWSTMALIKYAINNISSFSTAPMQLVTLLGILTLVIAAVFGATALVQKILGTALGGFTTVILILLFSSSVIMISLGIIGYYIAKIYEEVKGRPKYIVSKKCGNSK